MAANPDEIASQKPTLREKYDNYIEMYYIVTTILL